MEHHAGLGGVLQAGLALDDDERAGALSRTAPNAVRARVRATLSA